MNPPVNPNGCIVLKFSFFYLLLRIICFVRAFYVINLIKQVYFKALWTYNMFDEPGFLFF